MKVFTSLFILLIFVCYGQATCLPGHYKGSNAAGSCYPCKAGFYCPGNDMAYKCEKGSISQRMASKCSSCSSSGRSNEASTFCLLPSTPANAIEIQPNNPFLVYPNSATHAFITINAPTTIINSTFITFVGKYLNGGLVVYASNITPLPSNSNSLYQAIGNNATIASTIPNGILYFSLESKNSTPIEIIPKVLYSQVNKFNIDSEFAIENASFQTNILLFQYNEPVKKGRHVLVIFGFDEYFPQDFLALYSNNPNIAIPTPDNADVILPVNQLDGWRLIQPRDGPFVFTLYSPRPLYDVNIYISIIV